MPFMGVPCASTLSFRQRVRHIDGRAAWAARLGTKHALTRRMNHLRFLRYVDEVARVGSIRQAAERLHVAPSAVNRRVLDLEDELGTAIFERLPRGMRLTAAGELFVRYIRSRTADLDEVRSQIEELKGLRRGRVRVVASQALAPKFLPSALASFRVAHPLAVYDMCIGDHLLALKKLRSFEADIALVFNLAPDADINVMANFDQPLVAVMHRDHPLASQPTVRVRDCANYALVLPDRAIGGRQLLEDFLVRSSIQIRPVIESNSFEFMRGCLYHGQAVSFQIAIGTVDDGGALVTRPLADRNFPHGRLTLAALHGRQLPVIAHAFAEHLKSALTQP